MKDLWNYSNVMEPTAYCDDTSYKLAISFLDLPGCILEDWGCGTTYARKFVKHASYRGIDGSKSRFCERHVDLRDHCPSDTGCILIRHVLEHNRDWKIILHNAVENFRKRLCVVIHTPLIPCGTVELPPTEQCDLHAAGIPNLLLGNYDIREILREAWVRSELVDSKTDYRAETIIYAARDFGS